MRFYVAVLSCLTLSFFKVSVQLFAQTSIKVEAGILNSWNSLRREAISGELSNRDAYDRTGEFSSSFNFLAGIVIERKLSPTFALRLSPKYQQNGWKEKYTYIVSDYQDTISSGHYMERFTFSYLNLPLSFIFMAPVGKKTINFGPGVYVSLPLSGNMKKQQTDNGSANSDSTYFVAFNEKYNTCDCPKANSLDFGINLYFGISSRSGWNFELIYSMGLRNVLKDQYFILPNRHRYLGATLSKEIFTK